MAAAARAPPATPALWVSAHGGRGGNGGDAQGGGLYAGGTGLSFALTNDTLAANTAQGGAGAAGAAAGAGGNGGNGSNGTTSSPDGRNGGNGGNGNNGGNGGNGGSAQGGGLYVGAGTVTVLNTTIAGSSDGSTQGNQAKGGAGAVAGTGGTGGTGGAGGQGFDGGTGGNPGNPGSPSSPGVKGSDGGGTGGGIYNDTSGTIQLKNTIVASNTVGLNFAGAGIYKDLGHNLPAAAWLRFVLLEGDR